jgi:hypothetical protein
MNALYQPFCYILSNFFDSPAMIGLIVAITLAVGVIAWLTDMGGRGFPVMTFLVVGIGAGMLLGIPAIMAGMGIALPCNQTTVASISAAPLH